MRITNYLTLVGHGLHRGFVTAEVLFTAAAATAMCFSGAVLTTIHSEKTEPCELSVTAPSYLTITEQSIQDFHAIAGVVDATGVVEVPVIAAGGKYTASITLVGIDGEYLNDLVYSTGELFPAGGAMPWITLSKAAAQSFTDPTDKAKRSANYMPDIDWLGTEFSLDMGGNIISSRVSGIFESEEPAAYIGLDIAKTLLQNHGQTDRYTGARVRVTNAGAAESVSKAITGLGYGVENRHSARQEKWDAQTREAVYLAILSVAGLLCASMTRLTGAVRNREADRRRDDVLRWAGMSEAAIRGIGIVQGIFLALIGAAIGITVHYFIAALVGLNSGTTSNFALTLPPHLISLFLCPYIITGVLFTGNNTD